MATVNVPACYAVIEKDGLVLFVLRSNTGFMDGKYSLPAGHVEENETFTQGAAREAKEEVDLDVKPSDAIYLITQHRKSEDRVSVDVFFKFENWQGEPKNNEPERHAKIAWFPLEDLPDDIMDYQKNALESYKAGKTYTEFNW